MIVDVHTHNPEACDAIINASFSSFQPEQGKVYSVGVHPWDTVADVEENVVLTCCEAETSRPRQEFSAIMSGLQSNWASR